MSTISVYITLSWNFVLLKPLEVIYDISKQAVTNNCLRGCTEDKAAQALELRLPGFIHNQASSLSTPVSLWIYLVSCLCFSTSTIL